MITERTQAAIALLNGVYAGTDTSFANGFTLSDEEKASILEKLAASQLILLEDPSHPQEAHAYKPLKELAEVSLLDVLQAIDEHLDCNHPTSEDFYAHHGKATLKLGVVNHMTRLYLREIKLCDL